MQHRSQPQPPAIARLFARMLALCAAVMLAIQPAAAQSILRDAETEALLADMSRDLILAATFAAVLFSVLVQRATLGRLIEKLKRDHAPAVEDAAPAREPTVR